MSDENEKYSEYNGGFVDEWSPLVLDVARRAASPRQAERLAKAESGGAPPPEEIRSVDPDTGGVKGVKPARFDLIPVRPLTMLAEHFGRGAQKYEARNWEKGYAWSKSYAALQRHLNQFWGGEDIDPETGTPHVICAAWHCFALAEYMTTHPEKDDRSGK